MGAPSITYESPKIEKDNTFRDYLQYQQDRELQLDERADQARDRESAATRRRREQGALGFDAFCESGLHFCYFFYCSCCFFLFFWFLGPCG